MRRIVVTSIVLACVSVLAGFAVVHTATGGQDQEREELRRRLERLDQVTRRIGDELRAKAETLRHLRPELPDGDVKVGSSSLELDFLSIETEVYWQVWRELLEKQMRARIELELM